ncbi:hypothetical protein Q1695_004422 [Nippostrongylus brasiliensis]|nr:hypothetical protein Q1695_004422 [Nippostrongylus brasiliensis]
MFLRPVAVLVSSRMIGCGFPVHVFFSEMSTGGDESDDSLSSQCSDSSESTVSVKVDEFAGASTTRPRKIKQRHAPLIHGMGM